MTARLTKNSTSVRIQLLPAEHFMLDRLAQAAGLSISDYLRQIIRLKYARLIVPSK